MRYVLTGGLACLAVLGACGPSAPAAASGSATPEEAIQRVHEAARLIEREGEAALAQIQDPSGRFRWKDSYVFVFGLDGVVRVHPDPAIEGAPLAGLRDVHGKDFGAELLAIATSERGSGWSEYWWPEPGGQSPLRKVSFVLRVPGRDVAVGAGIHGVTMEEAQQTGR